MPMSVNLDTKSYEILSRIIAQAAARLNVMDLKVLHPSARLATPAVSLQSFIAKLAISFRVKPQPGTFAPIHGQAPRTLRCPDTKQARVIRQRGSHLNPRPAYSCNLKLGVEPHLQRTASPLPRRETSACEAWGPVRLLRNSITISRYEACCNLFGKISS